MKIFSDGDIFAAVEVIQGCGPGGLQQTGSYYDLLSWDGHHPDN